MFQKLIQEVLSKLVTLVHEEGENMRDCLFDETPIEDLTGDFEGGKILDYIGRHKRDQRLVNLFKNSSLNFIKDKYYGYVSKDETVTIKLSKDSYGSYICIRKGFKRKVTGNVILENILSCNNLKYSKYRNEYFVSYKNYKLNINMKNNNEIDSLIIYLRNLFLSKNLM